MEQFNTIGENTNEKVTHRSLRQRRIFRYNSSASSVRFYIDSLHRRLRNLAKKCRQYRVKISEFVGLIDTMLEP